MAVGDERVISKNIFVPNVSSRDASRNGLEKRVRPSGEGKLLRDGSF